MPYCPGVPKDTRFPDLDPSRIVGRNTNPSYPYLVVRGWEYPPPFAWHGDLLWRFESLTTRRVEVGPRWFRIRLWPYRVTIYRPSDRSELPPC